MQSKCANIMYETHIHIYGRIGKLRIVYYNIPDDKVKQLKTWFKALIPDAKTSYSRSRRRLEIKYVGTKDEIDMILVTIVKILYDVIYRGLSLEQVIQGIYRAKPGAENSETVSYY